MGFFQVQKLQKDVRNAILYDNLHGIMSESRVNRELSRNCDAGNGRARFLTVVQSARNMKGLNYAQMYSFVRPDSTPGKITGHRRKQKICKSPGSWQAGWYGKVRKSTEKYGENHSTKYPAFL